MRPGKGSAPNATLPSALAITTGYTWLRMEQVEIFIQFRIVCRIFFVYNVLTPEYEEKIGYCLFQEL